MKKLLIVAALTLAFVTTSCVAHIHTVGEGPKTNKVETARQWYILFGLVPLNKVDTNTMAGDAKNYEIKTETSVLDVLISIPASYITVSSRTVTVKK